MKTFARFSRAAAAALVGLLLFVGGASAQTALTSTTLSAAISNAADTSMILASVSGFTATSSSQQTYAVIDREVVGIRAINTTSLVVTITRGQFNTRGTGHASGATVYYIPPGSLTLSAFDRAGACTTSGSADPTQSAGTTPVINLSTNSHFQCISGQWERRDITDTYFMNVTGLAQPSAASPAAGGNALTVVGGVGGAQSATTGNGANGGAPSITGGVGGVGGTSSGTGGNGGAVANVGGAGAGTITGGVGGAVSSTGGVGGAGSTTAGAGGAASLTGGAGTTSAGTPGIGGAATVTSGAGGTNTGSGGTGAAGGATAFAGGAGGAASTGAATGGAGGAVTIAGGAGGGTITGGAGGQATLKGGAGANGSTAGGSGGDAVLQAGAVGTGGTGAAGKAKIKDAADVTKVVAFDLSGATTSTTTTMAFSTAASNTLTAPSATGGLPVALNCGATGTGNQTCSATAATALTKIYAGTSTLSTNAAVITFPVAFAATTSYQCVANDITTRANPVQMLSTSTNTATITNTTGGSDVINWICIGQ